MCAIGQPSDGDTAEEMANLRRQFANIVKASDRRGARRLLRRAADRGVDRPLLMKEVVGRAVDEVARSWKEAEISLSQVYAAGLIAEDAMETLRIPSGGGGRPHPYKVVIGTATGEYHGLGKRIVAAFLRAGGFEVVDLGLSASPETFIDAAVSEGASIVAVSALMADTALSIRRVRQEIEKRRLRGIKLLVGGAPFRYNRELYRLVGADSMAPTAFEAVQTARELVERGE